MLALEEAQQRILELVSPTSAELVPVLDACGRVLAADMVAPCALPPFDNSAMDGYAVRTADLKNATAAQPVALTIASVIAAGDRDAQPLAPGRCARIFTGSPLPPGANAVVMQEDVKVGPADEVILFEAPKPWENVRLQGEDIAMGQIALRKGSHLSVQQLALAQALGLAELPVAAAPRVSVLATGSELVEAGQPAVAGSIYESNRTMIAQLARQAGATVRIFPLIPDDTEATRTALAKAFQESEIVLTSGGASVGDFDLVQSSFIAMGGTVDFWKIAMKPGKPFICGRWQNKLLFGLPGNPVSAFATFLLLVRPALLKAQGAAQLGLPCSWGVLRDRLVNKGERRQFMRVRLDEAGEVWLAGGQGSHMLKSLADANALIDLAPAAVLEAGISVKVLRWE